MAVHGIVLGRSGDAPAGGARKRFWQNLGWYGAAEASARLTRLLTAIVLARWLDAEALGMAATALTLFELARVFAGTGLGQAVIRAPAAALSQTCAAAHRAAWAVCGAVAACQVTLGMCIALSGGSWAASGPMIACLAGVYLMMAPGLVCVWRIQRQNRLGVTARAAMIQALADNVLTAAMVATGFGAWGIVLPKLMVAPLWLIVICRAEDWRPEPGVQPIRQAELWRFALPVLGSELLGAFRLNLDKLLVGAFLGAGALGVYWFVFNAGLGLALSLTGALAAVVYPHLAELAHCPAQLLKRFDRTLAGPASAIAAVIAVQATASFVYVPLVFGDRWGWAAFLVAALCASAVTRPAADAAAQALRAIGQPKTELVWAGWMSMLQLGALAAGLCFGLEVGVFAMAAAALLSQAVFAVAGRIAVSRLAPRAA